MLNVFDPKELLMPIEPKPWSVTITDEIASGRDVPAARKTIPMVLSTDHHSKSKQVVTVKDFETYQHSSKC